MALLALGTCAFLSDADSFSLFKFSYNGLEAHARSVIKEAQATTDDLKKVAVAAAVAIVGVSGNSVTGETLGIMPPASKRDEVKDHLLNLLEEMGVSEADLRTVRLADSAGVNGAYAFGLAFRASEDTKSKADHDRLEELTLKGAFYDPDRAEQYMQSIKADDPKFEGLLADYREYLRTGRQRRPDVWATRDGWTTRSQ